MTQSLSDAPSEDSKNDLLKDIWPQERDFMSRPERYKYLRRLVKNEECVFCSAHKNYKKGQNFESLVLYENNKAMVILNKYPYNSGHIMVLPVKHCGDLIELSEKDYFSTASLLRETVRIVKKVYKCEGLNIGLNHGRVAGAGIPAHLHWHIIPRWTGDTNFFPLIAEAKVLSEELSQSYKRYSEEFSKLELKEKS